jgi:hypothetical protein
MTTTQHFRIVPDFFPTIEEATEYHNIQTNPRYKYFNQTHFTAGDEEQFQSFRSRKYFQKPEKQEKQSTSHIDIPILYKNLTNQSVLHTFRYIFHKFKKGVFIQCRDNKLEVMLPFSKYQFINEWSELAYYDEQKYNNWLELFEKCNKIENRVFKPHFIHKDKKYWYANNGLFRYEYPIKEQDSGIPMISDMFETLCKEYEIPDIEFFVNRRDFPILKKNKTEPYHSWFGKDQKLISHSYNAYSPILSMCSTDEYADILIPTWNDWSYVMSRENKFFQKSQNYNIEFDNNIEWSDKIETAIFRGSSTGLGTNIKSNMRMKLSYLSLSKKKHNDVLLLDAGITSWNARPRKNGKYIDTIDTTNLKLVDFMSFKDQQKYKYIINVDGHVKAFRLSYELKSGSVILMVESDYKLWYSDLLIPYEHYVPIAKDCSDIYEKIIWCKNNDEKCRKITENAKNFAEMIFTKKYILEYLKNILWNIKEQTNDYNYPLKSWFELQEEYELKAINNRLLPVDLPEITGKFNIPSYMRTFDLLKGIEWIFIKSKNITKFFPTQKPLIQTQKHTVNLYTNNNFNIIEKSNNNKSELIHEAFIGMYCVNECLQYNSNFAYTYHYDNDKLYTEYIEGETLYDILHNQPFSIKNWINYCLQICFTLADAQSKFAFVHQDLNPWNIIIQKRSCPITLYYVIGATTYKMTTKHIAVMIDYGKSHAIINNKHYGIVRPTHSSTIQDICCMVVSCFNEILKHTISKEVIQFLFNCVGFFSNTEFTKYQTFNKIRDLREWCSDNKRYSNITTSSKGELENKTPIDFAYFLDSLVPGLFEIVTKAEPITRQGSAKHVYNYVNGNDNIDELLDQMKLLIDKQTIYKDMIHYECSRICKSLEKLYPKCKIFMDKLSYKYKTLSPDIDYFNIKKYSKYKYEEYIIEELNNDRENIKNNEIEDITQKNIQDYLWVFRYYALNGVKMSFEIDLGLIVKVLHLNANKNLMKMNEICL